MYYNLDDIRALLSEIYARDKFVTTEWVVTGKNNRGHVVCYTDEAKVRADPRYVEAARFLQSRYDEGYGVVGLIKEFNLPITYPVLRNLFLKKLFVTNLRRGNDVVTDRVRESRRVRAKAQAEDNNNPFGKPQKTKYTGRGIQGAYRSEWQGMTVWLKSTWEYIYAQWLDSHKIPWRYEVRRYSVKPGESYMPDFFILDEQGKLSHIVEIKGYWRNREYKANLLNSEELRVVVIHDIKPFIKRGSNYEKEKRKWKQLCLNQSV